MSQVHLEPLCFKVGTSVLKAAKRRMELAMGEDLLWWLGVSPLMVFGLLTWTGTEAQQSQVFKFPKLQILGQNRLYFKLGTWVLLAAKRHTEFARRLVYLRHSEESGDQKGDSFSKLHQDGFWLIYSIYIYVLYKVFKVDAEWSQTI